MSFKLTVASLILSTANISLELIASPEKYNSSQLSILLIVKLGDSIHNRFT